MYSSDEEPSTNLTGVAFEQYRQNKNAENEKDVAEEVVEETAPAKKRGKVKAAVKNKPDKEEKDSGKDKKEWTDDEIISFIDMLEDNPCLWDVFHKDYSKRDIKEIAYTNIAGAFETNVTSVKTKINGLRAQLGREKAKETKTKSGQGADELYESSWIHYKRLSFLLPVIGSCKSRETIRKKKVIDVEIDIDDEDTVPCTKETIYCRKKARFVNQMY